MWPGKGVRSAIDKKNIKKKHMIELVFVNHNPMGSCRLNTSRHGHVWSASSAYSAQFVQESSCALVVVVVEQPEANQGDVSEGHTRSMTKYVPLPIPKNMKD